MSIFTDCVALATPAAAVSCLRCQGEGIVMTCLDPHCIEQNECIHNRYEDCPACQKQGSVT